MPTKLVVCIVLLAIGALFKLLMFDLVAAGIQIALMIGVIAGNNGVRTFLRGLAALGILINLVMGLAVLTRVSSGLIVISMLTAVTANAFLLWALGQEDVREWMFKKNFKLD